MLTKPHAGWCKIKIGVMELGTVSYMTDVPMDLLNAFIQYLSENNCLNFGVQFDAEGYSFGLIEFNDTLYFIHNNTSESVPVLQEIAPSLSALCPDSSRNMIKRLARELYYDIEDYFEDWIYWEADEKAMESEDTEKRRLILRDGLKTLKEKLNKAHEEN
mgnify:CR=1 FL=1